MRRFEYSRRLNTRTYTVTKETYKKTRIDKLTIFCPIVDRYMTTIFKKKILNFICSKKKLHNLIFF